MLIGGEQGAVEVPAWLRRAGKRYDSSQFICERVRIKEEEEQFICERVRIIEEEEKGLSTVHF